MRDERPSIREPRTNSVLVDSAATMAIADQMAASTPTTVAPMEGGVP